MASELKVNKITPESGVTLTLGDSGDTINFGSGVLPNFENLTVTGDLTVDTNSLKVDSTNNFVGIGTASPSVALDVVGAITATGNITGTLATAAQPNITSLGTLTGLTTTGDINLGDSDKINFGASNDFYIEHNGSGTFLVDQGTGNLIIRATDLYFQNSGGTENYLVATSGGGVNLRYANNIKLATTSTGITVTGTVVSDGLTVDGDATISDSNPSIYLNETDATDVNTTIVNSAGDLKIYTRTDAGVNSALRFNLDHATGDISFYEDTGTTPKLFWDASAERLGIGTSSPTNELMVAGGTDTRVTIDGSSSAGLYITDSGASGVTIRNTNDGDLEFLGVSGKSFVFNQASINTDFRIESDANANMFFVDASTNRVGIGTASPQNTFHVDSSDGTVARFITSSSSGILQVGNSQTGTGTGPELRFHHNNTLGSRIISESTEDFASAGNQSAKIKFNAKSNGNNYDMVTMIPGISRPLVGIGTTSPDQMLHIQSANTTAQLHLEYTGSGTDGPIIKIENSTTTVGDNDLAGQIQFVGARDGSDNSTYASLKVRMTDVTAGTHDGNIEFLTTSNGSLGERMRLTSDGKVGIGTSSPSYKLTILEGGNNFIQISQSGDSVAGSLIGRGGSTNLRIQNSENAATEFWTNNTERMRITSAGNVGIGLTSPGVALDVSGAIRATGDITAFYTSDRTLKTNIENISDPINKVKELNGVSYNWTEAAQKKYNHLNDQKEVGVIAQDVEKVLPEMVAQREDGTKAVRYERMCALLIECVKDLQNQIDELKDK
jgi:hypothetical protein